MLVNNKLGFPMVLTIRWFPFRLKTHTTPSWNFRNLGFCERIFPIRRHRHFAFNFSKEKNLIYFILLYISPKLQSRQLQIYSATKLSVRNISIRKYISLTFPVNKLFQIIILEKVNIRENMWKLDCKCYSYVGNSDQKVPFSHSKLIQQILAFGWISL